MPPSSSVRQSWLITITLVPAHCSPLMGTGSAKPRSSSSLYSVTKKSRTSGMRSISAVSPPNLNILLGSITKESSTEDFVSIPGGLGDGGDRGGDGGDGGNGGGGVGGAGGGSCGGGGGEGAGIGMASTTSATELTELKPMPVIESIIAELMVIASAMAGIASIARRWAVVATAGDPASATK